MNGVTWNFFVMGKLNCILSFYFTHYYTNGFRQIIIADDQFEYYKSKYQLCSATKQLTGNEEATESIIHRKVSS